MGVNFNYIGLPFVGVLLVLLKVVSVTIRGINDNQFRMSLC